MTDPKATRRCGWWALLGLLLILSASPAYLLLIDQPLLRATGAVGFILMGAGVVVGLAAARRDRRTWVRVLGGFDLTLLVLGVIAFFVLSALPAAPAFAALEKAPDFTLPDHRGQTVSLHEMYEAGPVLLVFFRGHW